MDPNNLFDRHRMMRRMVWSLPLRPVEKLALIWALQFSEPADYDPPPDHDPVAAPMPDELAGWLCVSGAEVERALRNLSAYGYLDVERGADSGCLFLTPRFDAIARVFRDVEEGRP